MALPTIPLHNRAIPRKPVPFHPGQVTRVDNAVHESLSLQKSANLPPIEMSTFNRPPPRPDLQAPLSLSSKANPSAEVGAVVSEDLTIEVFGGDERPPLGMLPLSRDVTHLSRG